MAAASSLCVTDFVSRVDAQAASRRSDEYRIEPARLVVFPYRESSSVATSRLGVGFVFDAHKATDPAHRHMLVVACHSQSGEKEPRIAAWCNDHGFTGALAQTEYQKHVNAVLESEIADQSTHAIIRERMAATHAMLPMDRPCSFWMKQRKGEVCKHLAQAYNQLLDPTCRLLGNRSVEFGLGVLVEEWRTIKG